MSESTPEDVPARPSEADPPRGHPARLGRYEIVRELGKGAMGVVYEGRDPNLGRHVAIKTARRDIVEASGRAEEMMERFLREARAAGNLNHPNIITVYDADREGDTAYYAMEYIQGTDLQRMLKQRRRYAPQEAAEIAACICDALAHAHAHGVVHRDVKPANVMVLPDGTLRVTDFGIARVADSDLTQEGALVGTPHYMSPEQFQGQRVDERSDLFSVAIILYEMLTGEKPFTGEALGTVMHNVTQQDPIQPKTLNVTINPTLNQVVLKALDKDPFRRYQTAEAMAAALRESVKPEPNLSITHTEPLEDHTLAGGGAVLPRSEDPTVAIKAQGWEGGSMPAADPGGAEAPTVIGGTHVQHIDAEDAAIAPATKAGGRLDENTAPSVQREAPKPLEREDSPTLAPSGTGAGAGKPVVYETPSRKPMLYAAAAAGFAVVGLMVYSVLSAAGGSAAPDGYSVAPGEPHFKTVAVNVFFLDDESEFVEVMTGDVDYAALTPGDPTVTAIFSDGTEVELGRLEGTRLGDEFELPGRPDEVTLIFRAAAYEAREVDFRNPQEPGDTIDLSIGAATDPEASMDSGPVFMWPPG